MVKVSFTTDNRPEHFFETAEEAWMWFCFCESTPKSKKDRCKDWTYPCEPVDVAIVVKDLIKKKELSQKHIQILSKYGLMQIPPHINSGDSENACALWKQALLKIFKPLKIKGIVSLTGRAFMF